MKTKSNIIGFTRVRPAISTSSKVFVDKKTKMKHRRNHRIARYMDELA